jgi:flagellar L-ring protein precursor FlgH
MRYIVFRSKLLVLLIPVLAATPAPAVADSLWQRGKANPVSLIADNRARRVGDIVTIVIEERQRVKNNERVGTDKSSSATSSLKFEPASEFSLLDDVLDTILPIELSSEREFEGNADFSKEGQFSTRITALVVDVMPNGNLVVEGRRKVALDGEEKWMTVSGICRHLDVAADNSIPSSLIANANVRYSSSGRLAANTERGWLDRAVDFIWPF